ncbi:MAG: CRISPR-associated endonuclease Cas3'' [Sulfuricellaceae bacterium]
MHVVLISACEKKSLKKTRAVLDSYAIRAGDSTWMTPITRAGLMELRMLLRHGASKNTAVACYQNEGRKQMKLLWIVGNTRKFGVNGAFPVASKFRGRTPLPPFSKAAALLASSAGFMHDIGKFGKGFQDKLRSKIPKADDVRHEWLSLFVVRRLSRGLSWREAWCDMQQYKDLSPFEGQLNNALDVLLFMVATHHRLPITQSVKGASFNTRMSNKGHVRDEKHAPTPVCAPEQLTLDVILDRLGKVQALPAQEPLYWRALALFSRMALILADHSVSAELLGHENAGAYANTDRKTGKMNQRLDWHLQNVGHRAGDMVFNILSLAPPSLSRDAVERICRRATGRYAWQEKAARALSASADKHASPHLVFNMAGTGSGKTHMNIRAVCELSHGKPVRVATALNLRTLTLQTNDAYADRIGIDRDELACVIGDRLTQALYKFNKQSYADDDENPLLEDYAAVSDFEYLDAPGWLRKFIDGKPNLGKVIGAPVLVSTIDFLIAAGELHRQGHHALAAMRLMTGDLILDEIDGYDPLPLLAVLRLVLMAGCFGRNVVVSSGTLSQPVASAVRRAYRRGIALRAALYGTKPDFVTATIDDLTAPAILKAADTMDFEDFYRGKTDQILKALENGGRYRIPYLQIMVQKDEAGFMGAIENAVLQLHGQHHLRDPASGKRISFGLVRMANINPAVQVAKYLSKRLPNAKIACYHAQHFPLLRFHIERRLDALLSRKHGDAHLFADREIRQAIDQSNSHDLLFIVVATPVEEIGRDHDFDWAVIEPSSTQSIVQTAGRVNRHRLLDIEQPNVAILQFNWNAIVNGRNNSKAVFKKPGLEGSDDLLYPSHDLEELFDWALLRHKLDAAARFGNHEFARLDNRNMSKATEKWLDRILGDGKNGHLWMCQDVYERTPLRERQPTIEITLAVEDIGTPEKMHVRESGSQETAKSRRFDIEETIANGWLYLADDELLELAIEAGVSPEDGLTVSVRGDTASTLKCKRHRSFGFYR